MRHRPMMTTGALAYLGNASRGCVRGRGALCLSPSARRVPCPCLALCSACLPAPNRVLLQLLNRARGQQGLEHQLLPVSTPALPATRAWSNTTPTRRVQRTFLAVPFLRRALS